VAKDRGQQELIDSIKDLNKTMGESIRAQGRAVGRAGIDSVTRALPDLQESVDLIARALLPRVIASVEKFGATLNATGTVENIAGEAAKVGIKLNGRQIDSLLGQAVGAEKRAASARAGVKERAVALFGREAAGAPAAIKKAAQQDLAQLTSVLQTALASLPGQIADAIKAVIPISSNGSS